MGRRKRKKEGGGEKGKEMQPVIKQNPPLLETCH